MEGVTRKTVPCHIHLSILLHAFIFKKKIKTVLRKLVNCLKVHCVVLGEEKLLNRLNKQTDFEENTILYSFILKRKRTLPLFSF